MYYYRVAGSGHVFSSLSANKLHMAIKVSSLLCAFFQLGSISSAHLFRSANCTRRSRRYCHLVTTIKLIDHRQTLPEFSPMYIIKFLSPLCCSRLEADESVIEGETGDEECHPMKQQPQNTQCRIQSAVLWTLYCFLD